ncbi:hypothetical protein C4H11_12745 [Bacteroides zoogleoformans]|uniref:Transmembrane protein n=1 Tax=Bacteroides zoogleoformans TaxID=28119 RepID=A0ABN5ILU3_9BACE|nr:hypothetical protein C4H11_12745 [Bacteroides zoogleoformans]
MTDPTERRKKKCRKHEDRENEKWKLNSLTSGIRIKSKKSDKMKLRYKISIWVALALAGSLLWGGSVWFWLAGTCVGKLLIRLLLTIALCG